nr:HNH endonuclease signature motif containing protein [Pseudomonas sp. CC120222-01a]
MEIAADEELKQYLELLDADNMRNGLAPFAPENHWVGRRMKIEIHHKHEIANGGAVYDLDNLLLMTPRVHIDHHKESNL